jgi:NADH:ubiquinone oxidoreductase subunit K
MIVPEHVLALSAALFGIGALIALVRRDGIAVLMGIQLMLGAICLAFVGFNRVWAVAAEPGALLDGQVFVLFALAAACAQVLVGVGTVIAFLHARRSTNVEESATKR